MKAWRSQSVPYTTSCPMSYPIWYTLFLLLRSSPSHYLAHFLSIARYSFIYLICIAYACFLSLHYIFPGSHSPSNCACLTHCLTPTLSIKLIPPLTITHWQFEYFGWLECILKCVPEIGCEILYFRHTFQYTFQPDWDWQCVNNNHIHPFHICFV
jgi:hypothetical protein